MKILIILMVLIMITMIITMLMMLMMTMIMMIIVVLRYNWLFGGDAVLLVVGVVVLLVCQAEVLHLSEGDH